MNIERIINAWRNEENRPGADEILPDSPIGEIDLSDTDLEEVAGGAATSIPCITASIATVSVIVSAVSAAVCVSVIGGGTCDQGTSGCCKK